MDTVKVILLSFRLLNTLPEMLNVIYQDIDPLGKRRCVRKLQVLSNQIYVQENVLSSTVRRYIYYR